MAYKILVVDDEPDIVVSAKNRLTREGYDVYTAQDGEEALVRFTEKDPDVVVLDLTMPKLNGFEVLQKIRSEFNDRWRPVIIVSASTDLDSLKKCYGLEADHYLTKPCTLDTLVRGIETMISLIPLRAK